jgi:hypothetical protein
LCAKRRRGALRFVGFGQQRRCRRGEFAAFVPADDIPSPGPNNPTGPGFFQGEGGEKIFGISR